LCLTGYISLVIIRNSGCHVSVLTLYLVITDTIISLHESKFHYLLLVDLLFDNYLINHHFTDIKIVWRNVILYHVIISIVNDLWIHMWTTNDGFMRTITVRSWSSAWIRLWWVLLRFAFLYHWEFIHISDYCLPPLNFRLEY
jgi:hypothetical protein